MAGRSLGRSACVPRAASLQIVEHLFDLLGDSQSASDVRGVLGARRPTSSRSIP
jgi:hypothetical protein